MSYTIDQKSSELKREIRMRVRVYQRRVESGRMSRQDADWRIDVMRSILRDYKAKKRKQKPTLFEQEA